MGKKLIALGLVALLAGCESLVREEGIDPQDPNAPICNTTDVTFSETVTGMIASRCASCHTGGVRSGGVSLDSYASVMQVVTPNEPENSVLYRAISHTGNKPMPQGGTKLPSCTIEQVKAWIEAGAPDN